MTSEPKSQEQSTSVHQSRRSLVVTALAATLLLTACTGGGGRNFDFPETPVRRGSF